MSKLLGVLLFISLFGSARAADPTQDLLSACGPMIGGRIDESEFDAFVRKYKDHFQQFPALAALSADELSQALTSVWIGGKKDGGALSHVFCGEFNPGKIGGLHWRERHLQLKKENLLVNEKRIPTDHDKVVTLSYEANPLIIDTKKPKGGYAADQSAFDMLAFGYEAAKKCCKGAVRTRWLRLDGLTAFAQGYYYKGKYEYYHTVVCNKGDQGMSLVTVYPVAVHPAQIDSPVIEQNTFCD